MLTELHIENFAIIKRLDINLKPGLVIFTGETGAGKSIIIDAVEMLLGGRAESFQVRAGTERAYIEGVFSLPESTRDSIILILENEGLNDQPEYVTLSREIRLNGRNIARINGRNVSVILLKELGEYLVDVHGQSEHLSLLRINQHLELLDRYVCSIPQDDSSNTTPLPDLFNEYQKSYREIREVQKELLNLRQAEKDSARNIDMLTYQITEIETAHLINGEEKELRDEQIRLANIENLSSLTHQALLVLDDGNGETSSLRDLFGDLSEAMVNLARLDSTQSSLNEQVQTISDNLDELTFNLRSYLENIEFNPKRLDQIEERIGLIQALKRKYGSSIEEIINYANNAKRQLDTLTHSSEHLENLEKELNNLMAEIGKIGYLISQYRHEAALRMENAVEEELSELHMLGAHFRVDFQQQIDPNGVILPNQQRVAYDAHGLERIEFLIAPNPGEGYKPLSKIASGGETSRLMLALKNVLVQADKIPTLIFDEIDQGIGGHVGMIVGQKLWNLSHEHQVLCITHLPQLAAYGELHFHVLKEVEEGRTSTQVKVLDENERVDELANMLGAVGESSLTSARELLFAVKNNTSKS